MGQQEHELSYFDILESGVVVVVVSCISATMALGITRTIIISRWCMTCGNHRLNDMCSIRVFVQMIAIG